MATPGRTRARFRLARRRARNIGAGAIAAIVCWHVLASFLWIAPPTPLRELVPGNLLQQYMLPWFGQSWSVFAPEPINGDNEILVRAEINTGAQRETTSWVNATDVEHALAMHNLLPPKAAAMGMHQAATFRTAWSGLSSEQREVVAKNYTSPAALERALGGGAGSASTSATATYLTQDERTRAYATNVAHSIWGARVTRVQYLVQRNNIVPFRDRNNPAAVRPAPIPAPTGWRAPANSYRGTDPEFLRTFRDAWRTYKDHS